MGGNIFENVETFKTFVKNNITLRPIVVFEKIHKYLDDYGYEYRSGQSENLRPPYLENINTINDYKRYEESINLVKSLEGYFSLQEEEFHKFHKALSNIGPLRNLDYNVILKARLQYVIYEFLRVPSDYRYEKRIDIPYKKFYEMYNRNAWNKISYDENKYFTVDDEDLKNENYVNIILKKLSEEIQEKGTSEIYYYSAAKEYLKSLENKPVRLDDVEVKVDKGGKRRKSSKKSKKRSKKSSKKSKKRSSKKSTKKRSTKKR